MGVKMVQGVKKFPHQTEQRNSELGEHPFLSGCASSGTTSLQQRFQVLLLDPDLITIKLHLIIQPLVVNLMQKAITAVFVPRKKCLSQVNPFVSPGLPLLV